MILMPQIFYDYARYKCNELEWCISLPLDEEATDHMKVQSGADNSIPEILPSEENISRAVMGEKLTKIEESRLKSPVETTSDDVLYMSHNKKALNLK